MPFDCHHAPRQRIVRNCVRASDEADIVEIDLLILDDGHSVFSDAGELVPQKYLIIPFDVRIFSLLRQIEQQSLFTVWNRHLEIWRREHRPRIEAKSRPDSLQEAFFFDCAVSSLILPNTIKDIGSYAFAECSLLTNITYVGKSALTNIGFFAFYKCENLSFVKIPASVEVIGDSAFFWCPRLLMILFEGTPPQANPPHLFESEGGCAYYLPEHANAWNQIF